jgi:hypothetical protein
MNCTRARSLLEEQIDGSLEHLAEAVLAEHLRNCEHCSREQEGMRALQAQLAALPVPPARAGFADRVLAAAHAARPAMPAPARNRVPAWIGGALAASLLLATGIWFGRQSLPEAMTVAVADQPVRLVFRSEDALAGVTIELSLPEGVELDGYPGQHHLVWQSDIQAGTNLLELPVLVHGSGGVLVATLNHGSEQRQFAVRVVPAAAEKTDV